MENYKITNKNTGEEILVNLRKSYGEGTEESPFISQFANSEAVTAKEWLTEPFSGTAYEFLNPNQDGLNLINEEWAIEKNG